MNATENSIIFKFQSLIPGGKYKNLSLFLFLLIPLAIFALAMMVAISYTHHDISEINFDKILPVLLKLYIQVLLITVLIFLLDRFMSKLTIVIDETGIRRITPEILSFLAFDIKWYEINKIEVSQQDKRLAIYFNHRYKAVNVNVLSWKMFKNNTELNFKKLPITKFGLMKFDVLDTPVITAIQHFLDNQVEIKKFEQTFVFRNSENLGKGIKSFMQIAVGLFVFALLLMAWNNQVYLGTSFYWQGAIITATCFFIFTVMFLYKDLMNNSKSIGVIFTALLMVMTGTYAVNEGLYTYSKFYGISEPVELELVFINDKIMHWQSNKHPWKLLKYGIHHDFEKNIKVGSKIHFNANKGPFKTYTATFDSIDAGLENYKIKD